ncbi:RNA polymerase II transcription mediator complex subunit 9-domain-containing protein [Halenospora varia]|nr:RNA polymerase II transcription mediator complex subunit 9-domain-containing protein [Halenospora varia]
MTTPSHHTQPPPSSLGLPEGLSADSIDTLPVLSALLSRLQNPSTTSTSTAGSPPAASPSQIASGNGPLTIKDIPAATDELKHKVQKARAQVKELPDMDRTITEQEDEIRELEEKIARQREVLVSLRDVGAATKRDREKRERDGDINMEG